MDKSESEDKDEDKEDKDEDKITYVGVLADGLRHAGRQSVGRERVAPSQAELRRMSVSEVEVIFRVELYARTSPVPQKPNSPE